MSLIRPQDWIPVGVDSLEPAADRVVHSDESTLVVAGPGAGKTELLAQRACFLLDTGLCQAPRRILAISFKKDAAKNLGDRVRSRCSGRSSRFESYTLDAFAKSLVDRFMLALPEEWRPRIGYEVMTRSLNVHAMRQWIESAGAPPGHAPLNVQQAPDEDVRRGFDILCHGCALPYHTESVKPLVRHLGLRWWKVQLEVPVGRPSLTFPMLNRLAAFLLRCNPKLTKALRDTYSYVFLDEFQDTTASQYDLVQTAFCGSRAILTAVGDSKQRIMVWAGAMTKVFEVYKHDFSAERHQLASNYRSAPELVRMQHLIAQAVEAGTPPAIAARSNSKGSCAILEFNNPEQEAEYLADILERGILREKRNPRDYCVLVRQRTAEMITQLRAASEVRGIRLRDESLLQDLLVEPVVRFLLAVLRLATRSRAAEAWDLLRNEMAILFGLDEGDDAAKIEREAKGILRHAREALHSGQDAATLLTEIVDTVGEGAFRSVYRQYQNGSYLREAVDNLSTALRTTLSGAQSGERSSGRCRRC